MQLIKFRVYVCVVHTWLVETVVYSRARPSRKLVLGSTPPPSPFSRTILRKRRQTNPFFSSFPSRLADPCNAHPCFFASHRRTRCYSSNLCFRFSPSSSLFPRVFFFFFVTGFDFVFIASFTVISRWNTWYTQTIHGDKSRGGRIIRARYLRYIGRNTRYLIYYGKTQFIRNGFVAFGYRPLGITRKLRLVAVEKNVSRIAQWGRGGGGGVFVNPMLSISLCCGSDDVAIRRRGIRWKRRKRYFLVEIYFVSG